MELYILIHPIEKEKLIENHLRNHHVDKVFLFVNP